MNWNTTKNKKLLDSFLALDTPVEAKAFLRDLMTEPEIAEFANRLRAAEMLSANETYVTIEKETGLSSATIARVAKWLRGTEGGYKNILAKHHTHST